jgi:hypothetical protein
MWHRNIMYIKRVLFYRSSPGFKYYVAALFRKDENSFVGLRIDYDRVHVLVVQFPCRNLKKGKVTQPENHTDF